MKKRGFLEMSFGMIFSILLIIVFLSVAIYAIVKFLDTKDNITSNQFIVDLQKQIDVLWQGSQGSVPVELNVPKDVRFFCFFNSNVNAKPSSNSKMLSDMKDFSYPEDNAAFYPLGSSNKEKDSFQVEHVNITKITTNKNPYCFESQDGKVKLALEKAFVNNRLESLVNVR